jgi:predicted DNA-binding transcriptional regulator AlpA
MVDELFDPIETARILGIKPSTLAVWRSKNFKLGPRFVTVGRRIRYRMSAIEEYIQSRTVETKDSYSLPGRLDKKKVKS